MSSRMVQPAVATAKRCNPREVPPGWEGILVDKTLHSKYAAQKRKAIKSPVRVESALKSVFGSPGSRRCEIFITVRNGTERRSRLEHDVPMIKKRRTER